MDPLESESTSFIPKDRIFTTRDRKGLIEKIAQLSATEHEEILKIVRQYSNIAYSQNRNGVFINLKTVPNDLVCKINEFVQFCLENKEHLDEYDKRINECKLGNKLAVADIAAASALDENSTKKSQPLAQVMSRMRESSNHDAEWHNSLKETKAMEKVENLLDVLETNFQKIHKKKTCNMKFSNAKKKYARRVGISDKRGDMDMVSNLTHDVYVPRKIEAI